MVLRAETLFTPEEYLAIEEKAEIRSEYYGGKIHAMSGGSANHNRVTLNAALELRRAVASKPCEVFVNDLRLLVRPSGLYTYPDVMVVCGKIEFLQGRTDTVTNPIVIVKVLSESTQDYERGRKFFFYREPPTLEDYVLIHQDRVYVEYNHRLENNRWLLETYDQLEDNLALRALDVEIPLAKIYETVDWSQTDTNANP